MAPDRRRASVIAHIDAISRQGVDEAERIAATMLRHCWPGGEDRTEPGAREWLRRWRPSRGAVVADACTCRQGACPVCN
jgi:hypothetical protein